MDFQLNEEQKIFKQAIRDFAEKEIQPLVEEFEAREEFPRELMPKMGKLNYLGPSYPPHYGGGGMEKIGDIIWGEELARVCSGIAFSLQSTTGLPACSLRDFGTEEQRQKYLAPMLKGEKMGCYALTEPDAGSDAAAIQTTAVKDGNSYIINGSKMFITNGSISDFYLIVAYTDKNAGPSKGMSMFLVDRNTPGFSCSRKLHKAGQKTADHAELALADCRIPAENLLPSEGRGFASSLVGLDESRVNDSARAVGVAQAAFEASVKYAQERKQFGQPVGRFEGVSFMIAEMATAIDAARWLTLNAAWLAGQKGVRYTKEAAMAHLFSAQTVMKVAIDALQVHGGYGYMMDSPVQRYFRDAKLFSIIYGTSEIQKMVIARTVGL